MKNILYIGNKLEKHGAAPTSVDILPDLLAEEGLEFKAVSHYKNKVLRLLHMLSSILRNSKKIDLVLIDTYSTSNFWYAVMSGYCCSMLKLPYIFILHGGNLVQRFSESSPSILRIFKKAYFNIVPSKYLLEQLETFELENLLYIPNAISVSQYPFKARKNLKPRILWVRAFDKVYRPKLAVKIISELQKEYPEAELCMVGPEKDGSFEKTRAYVEKHGLPVKFCGKLSKTEWAALSEDYDIFLNTSSVDNLPVSVLEAMALGLPVVSASVGGLPYLIEHDLSGKLAEGTVKDLTHEISDLLQNPTKAESISKNARLEAEKYDWERLKEFWIDLLG
ncbi:glycosyl transferase family 1 [Christiangramia fulva]|uniref:Glycosyl transferase family 1 n=1 Tax=Christiangramia fulva TaxID=2126553 RepID=A0A2R3Z0P7_9FLAO|nr:glycosyltransferase family 4 protein [Christiangramia fulva]AVR43808.1 glycosyl transferase family 1 [Christiangramia fulva]